MRDLNEDAYSLQQVMNSLNLFLMSLKKQFLFLILSAIIGAGLGTTYFFIQSPKYKAASTFILEEKSIGSGGLAGIASQFGLNLGSLGSGGSIFSGDNILNILKSRKVIQEVLLRPVDPNHPGSKTLADHYLEFTGAKNRWISDPRFSHIDYSKVKGNLDPIEDSIINVMHESIVKNNLLTERTSKQGTIIKVQVTSADPLFARLLTERLVDEASKMYLEIRVGTAQENIRHLQRRSDSLLLLLNNKSFAAAASQPLDINPALRTAIVPVEIATRDKNVLATLYAEVTKNLEVSKLLLTQQTPVIQLLDHPAYLLTNNKKGIIMLVILGIMVGISLYVGFAFVRFLFFGAQSK